ncbi:MAG: hypothetical protein EZS28_021593 [Streblomastix strix]|uniref:DUF4371 domain-containing protein n=1 Tax=Streblomastix strix TaxID=222440 RepID=A0A5J4VJX0_9EUKA|nr:MAG: hypothetical protein EZS28_021593 [Streblomastix strix]
MLFENAEYFGLCIDESTDISSLNQFATFIRFIDKDNKLKPAFLDIRPLSSKGATAENFLSTFYEMCQDHGLNLKNFMGICVDGASNMIGCRHSMTQMIRQQFPQVTIVHCCAHKLNLSSFDSIHATELQPLRSVEAITQQFWQFFVASPLHVSILEDIHKLIQDGQVKLK